MLRAPVEAFEEQVQAAGEHDPQPGESLRLRGHWTSHPQYGRQFQVDTYQTVLPATIQGSAD